MPVCFMLLNPGEQVEQLQEFQELEVAEPTDPDREHSVTNVEEVECSTPTLPGEDGTEKSILPKEDTLLLQQSPPQLFLHWS